MNSLNHSLKQNKGVKRKVKKIMENNFLMFFYSIDLSRINKRKRTNVYKIKKNIEIVEFQDHYFIEV